ncbi:MAG: hypothetical protein RIM84_27410 [Alphaproteobacteria bacterium]
MQAVWLAIVHTPLWVWPLIAFSLWLGARELRPHTVPAGTLYILPAMVVILALVYMLAGAAPKPLAYVLWLAAAAPFAALGWVVSAKPLAIHKDQRTIDLPRRVVPLALIVAIICLRYAFGYIYGRWPDLKPDPTYALVQVAIGAAIAGVALGYYGRLLRRFHTAG